MLETFHDHHCIGRRDKAKADRESSAARSRHAFRFNFAHCPSDFHNRLCHCRAPCFALLEPLFDCKFEIGIGIGRLDLLSQRFERLHGTCGVRRICATEMLAWR
jgi:hypothetical protein